MKHFRQHPSRRQCVTVYNADYRVLTHVTWQEAVRLMLRGSVYVIERHSPAVHIHSPSTVIELPVSVALRGYIHVPYRSGHRAARAGVLEPGRVLRRASGFRSGGRRRPRACGRRWRSG